MHLVKGVVGGWSAFFRVKSSHPPFLLRKTPSSQWKALGYAILVTSMSNLSVVSYPAFASPKRCAREFFK